MENKPHPAARRCRSFLIFSLLLLPGLLPAQLVPQVPPGAQMQLQVQQPAVDTTSPVSAVATFDPPVVHAGEKTLYRITVDATESSVRWPDEIPAPDGLEWGPKTSGQITQMQLARFRPLTTFLYEATPTIEGHFTISNLTAFAGGTRIDIPAASLEVVPKNIDVAPTRRLRLELSQTNLFLGQPFHARVILPGGANNEIEALREVEIRGDGLMVDKTALQGAIEPVVVDGKLKMSFVAELTVTPIAPGRLKFFAQGFSAGREFMPPLSIHGQVNLFSGVTKYLLLKTEPLEISVRPLPTDGQPVSFTGAIGRFFYDPPALSANRLQVGEPVRLRLSFHGEGDLTRFAPPPEPRSRDWQIIADPPPSTSFTLIPLNDDVHETPPIPFSYFDPDTAKYVELTVPTLPVTVTGQGLPTEMSVYGDEGKREAPVKLSSLASIPGMTAVSIVPLPLRSWFIGLQLAPLAGFLALWLWDRRRRFLEAHPEIVRRVQARRALKRERRQLQAAIAAGDHAAFIRHAAQAMTIAVAPHFPANPRALVCGDVLAQLDQAGQNGQSAETVKRVFAAADAGFAAHPQTRPEVMELRPGVESVLQKLEEKLCV